MDEHIREPIHRPGTEIDGLFAMARQKEASDVYLADGDYPVLKIHDKMVRGTEFRKVHEKDLETLFHNCLTETEQQQFADRLEVEFTYATETAGTLQVMLYETEKDIGAACRLVPSRLPALEEIGPPEALKKIPAFDRGLVLITGKANCQKSTTIASIIDHINTHQSKSIVTIEDPIRFVHESKSSMVFQREIGLQALNYPGAIGTAMRTDMDVIYFTEIDGPETLSSAMNAAESRLVISTSVSFGGVGWAIRKLFENYPEERQEYSRTHLSRVLKCLIWQHPVPVKGHTNTKIAMEILFNNQKISDMIRKNALHKVHGEIQKGQGGMQTMHQAIHTIGGVVTEIGKSIAADVGTAFLLPCDMTGKMDGHMEPKYRVKHAISGRLRVTFPDFVCDQRRMAAIRDYLNQIDGVNEVKTSHHCASATIFYQPEIIRQDNILEMLDLFQADKGSTVEQALLVPDGKGAEMDTLSTREKAMWKRASEIFGSAGSIGILLPLFPGIPLLMLAAFCRVKAHGKKT